MHCIIHIEMYTHVHTSHPTQKHSINYEATHFEYKFGYKLNTCILN